MILGFQDSSPAQWFGFPPASLAAMSDSYVTPIWTLSIEFYGSILLLLLARSRSWTLLILATVIFCSHLFPLLPRWTPRRDGLISGGKRLLAPWPVAAAAATIGLAVCLTSRFWSPEAAVEFCAWSAQILPPCPLAKTAYLMRVYGAIAFTLGVMQCAPIRTFLAHERLRALGRLSFPIYLTHWPIIFGLGSFSARSDDALGGALPARFLALLVSIAVTIFAATCFEPVDQIALRVSRAWRKQKVAE